MNFILPHHKVALVSALLLAIFVLFFSAYAMATLVSPVAFEDCLDKADLIFSGTVTHLQYMDVPRTVITKVIFRNLTIVKGDLKSDSLELRVTGGVMDGKLYVTLGYPTFELTNRYIVCVSSGLGTPKDNYEPIIFWNQGFFPILTDSISARASVHDCDYRPIIRIQGKHLVVSEFPVRPPSLVEHLRELAKRHPRQFQTTKEDTLIGFRGRIARIIVPYDKDPGSRIGEDEFVRAVRQILRDK